MLREGIIVPLWKVKIRVGSVEKHQSEDILDSIGNKRDVVSGSASIEKELQVDFIDLNWDVQLMLCATEVLWVRRPPAPRCRRDGPSYILPHYRKNEGWLDKAPPLSTQTGS